LFSYFLAFFVGVRAQRMSVIVAVLWYVHAILFCSLVWSNGDIHATGWSPSLHTKMTVPVIKLVTMFILLIVSSHWFPTSNFNICTRLTNLPTTYRAKHSNYHNKNLCFTRAPVQISFFLQFITQVCDTRVFCECFYAPIIETERFLPNKSLSSCTLSF